MTNRSLLLLAAGALALGSLGACTPKFNGPLEAADVDERHPITVDQQTISMTVAVDPSLAEMSNIDRSRLNAFADTYFARGHGPVTITAPAGSSNDLYAQETVAEIREALHATGVDYGAMRGATYRAGAGGDIIVSYTGYVASPSTCGLWDDEFELRSRNLKSKNFGCAQQNNLAAMIADPRDLVEPGDLDPTDSARQSVVRDGFVAGEATSSERDPNTQVSSQ